MKNFIIILLLALITSCAIIDENKIAPGYTEAYRAINNLIFGYKDDIPYDLIESIPYASSLIHIGKGPRGLMILESKKQDVESWITADGITLLIKNGRIIRTFGLEHNLVSLKYTKLDIGKPTSLSFNFYYSYDEPFLQDLGANITKAIKGKEVIRILDKDMELTLVEETLISNKIRWKAVNKYWIDSSGFVWRSEQSISPKLPPFHILVTKKPSE